MSRFFFSAASATFFIRVPPGVTKCDVVLLVSDDGEALVTSTNDATGTELHWSQQGDDVIGDAVLVNTGGVNTGDTAADGGPLTVRGAAAWTWVDETVTVAVTGTGTVWGVGIVPLHVSQ